MKSITRISVLMGALMSTRSLRFAAEATQGEEPEVPKGNGGDKPSTAGQARRTLAVNRPILDVENMSPEQMKAKLIELQSQLASSKEATRSFRFNDGSDPTLYAEGEQIRDENGRAIPGKVAKGGEVKSKRDSGTISVYGFQRNPISLYPNQWLSLFAYASAIVEFIATNNEHITEYLRKRNSGRSDNDVNMDLVEQLRATFEAEVELTTLRGQIRAYDAELLDVLNGLENAATGEGAEEGVVHTVEGVQEAEVGGEG